MEVRAATDRQVVDGRRRARLESIFAEPAPDEVAVARAEPAVSTFFRRSGAITALTLISVLRLPDSLALDSIWAEDGRVFLSEPLNEPGLTTIFRAYGGYYQLLPRLIGIAIARLPLSWAAAAMSLCAAFVTALVSVYVFRASASHVRSVAARYLLAGAVVLLPIAGYEMIVNVSNLHWYLQYGAFWALIWKPRHPVWILAGSALCFFAGATDGLAAILVPIAGLRVVAVREVRQQLVGAALAAGLALQVWVVLGGAGLQPVDEPTVMDLGKVYAVRVALASFAGDALTEHLFRTAGWMVAALGLAGFAWAWLRAARVPDKRPVLFVVMVLHLVLFLVPVVLRWDQSFIPRTQLPDLDHSSRMFALPLLLVWTGWAVAWDAIRHRAVGVAAVLLFVFVAGADFIAVSARSSGPRWSEGIRLAAQECAAGATSARVLITPATGDWYVELPCHRVL